MKSRKFWLAVGTPLFAVLIQFVGFTPEQIEQILDLAMVAVPSFIGFEGLRDAARAFRKA